MGNDTHRTVHAIKVTNVELVTLPSRIGWVTIITALCTH